MQKKLDQMSVEELGRLFPIEISQYNSRWPLLFSGEKKVIVKAIGERNILRIEHIGSTSVPGLNAKPIIDILLFIPESEELKHIIESLKNAGYHYIPKPENPAPGMLFVKGYTQNGFRGQAYHVHVRYAGYDDELFFRDYLISHQQTAKEYVQLKLKLKAEFEFDREAYTESKTEFCRQITALAKKQITNPASN